MVWIGNLAWGVGSIVGVEMVRDLYHVSAHIFPPLIRLHNWHHRVFRPDLTPVSEEIYRQAHWYNDVPEAGVMLSFSLIFLAIAHIYTPENQGFALLGCIYTLSFLFSAIGRGMGIPNIDKLTDLTHTPGEFDRPPAPWMVNRTYHWRHHFDNQNSYFCGTLTLLDKIMGTALSLKGKPLL